MHCLRCGYCCKQYMVVIVKDPEKGIRPDNLVAHKGGGKACRHLQGLGPGKYRCAVHGRPWYRKTPCFAHGQIENSPDDPCRIGEYVLKQEGRSA